MKTDILKLDKQVTTLKKYTTVVLAAINKICTGGCLYFTYNLNAMPEVKYPGQYHLGLRQGFIEVKRMLLLMVLHLTVHLPTFLNV